MSAHYYGDLDEQHTENEMNEETADGCERETQTESRKSVCSNPDEDNNELDIGTHVEMFGLSVAKDDTKMEKVVLFQCQIDDDEGCVTDMSEARTYAYGQYPLTEDGLPPANKPGGTSNGRFPDDSGFSSRVSEDSASLHRSVEIAELNKAVAAVALGEESANDCADERNGSCCYRLTTVLRGLVKIVAVLLLLYIFICSLDLLSNAFRLLGGKTAGSVFQDNALLQNPITGLMIGVLATVILQSSSTSTSIVITMVSSGILGVRPAIPVIMGANIGTTVTNTLVSLAHSMDPHEFRRAFSGATVHDVFNWLTVLILLPLEHFTGYLYHLTLQIVTSLNMEELRTKDQDLLNKLTKPLTTRIVLVDKDVITDIAEGNVDPNARLLKIFCTFNQTQTIKAVNKTLEDIHVVVNETEKLKIPVGECDSLLSMLGWSDTTSGILLFFCSLLLLSSCLYLMVKLLHSILGSKVAELTKKTINANFPGPFACLTDYVALVLGAAMTILVQSSSVFTSALTPLVGVGCLKLERMYPLTLGSNIGTTATGILAALASSSSTMKFALQLALCHLFFNITGILLFFPIPIMRRFPLHVARFLGRTTARYRWFAVFYLLMMFLVLPGCLLALSFTGDIIFIIVLSLIGLVVFTVAVISLIQRSRFKSYLPTFLHTWHWLPLCLRSLQPLDNLFHYMCTPFKKICCSCCLKKCECLGGGANEDVDSEDESDINNSSTHEISDSDTGVNCCCHSRDTQGIQQSNCYMVVMEEQPQDALVWHKRTSRPIYRAPQKSHQPSPAAVPLIGIPESIV